MPDRYYAQLLDLEGLDPDLRQVEEPDDECAQKLVASLLRRQQCGVIQALLTTGVLPKLFADKVSIALATLHSTTYGLPLPPSVCSPRAIGEHEILLWRPAEGAQVHYKLAVEVPVRSDWQRRGVNAANAAEVLAFYRETESYIWELMAANNLIETLYNYGITLKRLADLGVDKALDYGAGIGSFVLAADASGIEMTHMDLHSPTLHFARWRYAARQRSIMIREASGQHDDIPASEAIVCTEVVEHVTEPLDLLDALAGALAEGGILAVSESCGEVEKFSSHLPQNRWLASGRFLYEMRRRGFHHLHLEPAVKIMLFEKRKSVRTRRRLSASSHSAAHVAV